MYFESIQSHYVLLGYVRTECVVGDVISKLNASVHGATNVFVYVKHCVTRGKTIPLVDIVARYGPNMFCVHSNCNRPTVTPTSLCAVPS